MSKRALILVEGQTEERFVKQVLGPHLAQRDLYVTPTILTTKVVKRGPNFKGGITNFAKFESDLRRLLHGAGPAALVTMLIDYYRLPNDFPGMADRPATADPFTRVTHVENSLARYFDDGRFVPFLSLHEFEAWLLSCPTTLPEMMAVPGKQAPFADICTSAPTPEQINDRPDHNPAARIEAIFPAYQKVLHGPTAVARIGLQKIRQCCHHFNDWLKRIESFAGS